MADTTVSERIARQRGLRDEVEEEMPDLETEVEVDGEEAVGIVETDDDDDVGETAEMAAEDDKEDLEDEEPLAVVDGLPDFEGREVARSKLKLTKAGDGLSEALALKPRAYRIDGEIYLVVRAVVKHVDHLPAEKDGDELARVHSAEVAEITEVSESDVGTFLAIARERIRNAKDDAEGQTSLLDVDEEEVERVGVAGLGPKSDFDPEDLPDA